MNELTWEELERLINEQEDGGTMGQDTSVESRDAERTSNSAQVSAVGEVSEEASNDPSLDTITATVVTLPPMPTESFGTIVYPPQNSNSDSQLLSSVGVEPAHWAQEDNVIVMEPLDQELYDAYEAATAVNESVTPVSFVDVTPVVESVADQQELLAETENYNPDARDVLGEEYIGPSQKANKRRGRPKKIVDTSTVVTPPVEPLKGLSANNSIKASEFGLPLVASWGGENVDVLKFSNVDTINISTDPSRGRFLVGDGLNISVSVKIEGSLAHVMAMLAHINKFGKE